MVTTRKRSAFQTFVVQHVRKFLPPKAERGGKYYRLVVGFANPDKAKLVYGVVVLRHTTAVAKWARKGTT